MIPAPSATYHAACGSPPVDGAADLPAGSVCATCGFSARRGVPMRKWSGAESLILDKLTAPGSAYACEACVFACTWIAPPFRKAKEGQSKGPAPTMYSHLVVTDDAGKVVRYANASKGEKPVILGWLRERFTGPWWLVIADMGKKQLIPWAQWNLSSTSAGAIVHLDDEAVTVGDLTLPGAMAEMLTLGATKASMERGDYTPGEWSRCGEALRAFERGYGNWRGSGWWRMSLWLAQRDEDAVAERMADEKAAREAKKAAEKEAAKAAKAKPAKPAAAPAPAALVVAPTVALAQRVGQPCDPARAEPLRILATLDGPIVSVPMMDSLLAYTVAQREGLPPVMVGDAYADIDIPVMRSPCGRFHLASAPIYRAECYDTRHRNRRFPMAEAQMFAEPALRRINIQNGATKSFRVPYQQMHLQGDQVLWYATGDRERIEVMLGDVLYLGRQRAVGKGRVVRWSVEPVGEPWAGFPVMADGQPMRPLPLDWPGVTVAERRLATLSYPYTDNTRRQPCLVGAES